MKLSFIIPAYNAEATIDRAIDSILALKDSADCPELEIIIVENGSTDITLEKAQTLSEQHEEIQVFRSEKGVSKARNRGIRQASGEWLIFIDADDQCDPDILQVLPMLSAFTPDFAAMSYRKNGQIIRNEYKNINQPVYGDALPEAGAWMLVWPTQRMTVWAKIFRRDFLVDHGLLFDEDLRFSEDSEFLIRALNQCESMIISDVIAYHYITDSPSVMRGADPGRIEAYLKSLEKASQDMQNAPSAMQNAFREYVSAHISLIAVHDIFDCNLDIPWKQRCRNMSDLMKKPIMQDAAQSLHLRDARQPQNLPALLSRYHMTGVAGLICLTRSIQNKNQNKARAKRSK